MEDQHLNEQDQSTEIDSTNYAEDLGRYMIQGIIVSPILLGIIFLSVAIFRPDYFTNPFVICIIVFSGCIILVLFGLVNAHVTDYLWEKKISKHWLNLLCHGFFLFIGSILIVLGSLILMLNAQPFDNIISYIGIIPVGILLILGNGVYGKKIAVYVTNIGSLLRLKNK